MASKIKADQFETLDGNGNITLNNSVTMASTKTLPAGSLTGALPAISAASLTAIPAANITGTIAAVSGVNLTALNATNLGSGTVPTARLGSGTASSSVFLRGDGSWQTAGSTSASDLTSGTLPMARLSGTLPALNGSALTNISAGKVLQVVQGSTDVVISMTSATSVDTGLTATITPSATSSKILVIVCMNGMYKRVDHAANDIEVTLLRGSTLILTPAKYAGYTGSALANYMETITGTALDSPSTTSATTYKTQFRNPDGGAAGGTITAQEANGVESTITLIEIGA